MININPNVRYQTMLGFGAAMTDSSTWLLYDQLTPAQRTQTFQNLFSPQGINLDYVRIPMAASDYTVSYNPYSYDDIPAGHPFSAEASSAFGSVSARNTVSVPRLLARKAW